MEGVGVTKLTQQEIEKERENFDSWMSVRYDGMADLRFMISEYKSIQVNNHWKAWLARAELTKMNINFIGFDWASSPDKTIEISREKFNELYMCSFDSVDELAKGK